METVDMAKKKGLGRGLGALLEKTETEFHRAGAPLMVSIESITPNPYQPRSPITDKDIASLSESIKDRGVLEPLLVRTKSGNEYELIAGERRLRASQAAGLSEVPVLIREVTPSEMLELALIENLHREDLNPMEEAESYRRLAEEFGRSNDDIARMVGKDRSTVANLVRLLGLPDPVKEDVRQGRLTVGHARALLALNDRDRILTAREQILLRNLSVRETEKLVKKALNPTSGKRKAPQENEAYFQAIGDEMSRKLGTKVKIVRSGKKSRIEIDFKSNAVLEHLMNLLGLGPV